MRDQTKMWLLSLRESDGLKFLIEDLEKDQEQANITTLNKAREISDKVFYQAGVHDGIKRVITSLKLTLNPDGKS